MLRAAPYLRDAPPEIDRAWGVTEALIAAMKSEVERDGASFRIAVLPTTPEIVGRFDNESFDVRRIESRGGVRTTLGPAVVSDGIHAPPRKPK